MQWVWAICSSGFRKNRLSYLLYQLLFTSYNMTLVLLVALQIGSFEWHRMAWKVIVDEQWQLALIMEDDAQIDLSVDMGTIITFLKEAPPDWDILHLGIGTVLRYH